ncbi:MAG: amidase [Granulosicoccus sp.]
MIESDGTTDSAGKQWEYPLDPLGAFCRDNHISLEASGSGQLNGLTFAAKDVMDIIGSTTGFGQPAWLRTHDTASASAEVVDRILGEGARLVGKTITDELSYSLTGENTHYGTPLNPKYPDRIPGGSSSGSVSAVAGNLVDFALGTDCAGSVRLPASYCGVLGIRPTHGHVPTQGVIPFAPSFDTLGWLARDADVLRRVGSILLGKHYLPVKSRRLLIATDCFALVGPEIRDVLMPSVNTLRKHFSTSEEVSVSPDGLESWMECFRTIQGAEIWNSLGTWIQEAKPELGPGIDERIAWAQNVTSKQLASAQAARSSIIEHLQNTLLPGDVLCLPSSPRVAPLKGTATSTVEITYRYQAICLLSIAGLGGLPEISLPMAKLNDLPLGLSVIGSTGADQQLLELACDLQ